jgi:hypothetical protein
LCLVVEKFPGVSTREVTKGVHGPITAPGGNAGVAVGLDLTGVNSGVVASGTATDPADAELIAQNPENFYFNVHTETCPGGALRGSLA